MRRRHGVNDWEEDDERPGVHYLTIVDPDGEELAIIVHRTNQGFPLDGPVAQGKVERARRIVAALDAATSWPATGSPVRSPHRACSAAPSSAPER